MEDRIKDFLFVSYDDGYCFGDGSGSGSGSGYGNGYGDGCGSGRGPSHGSDYCDGDGSGYGVGYGYRHGNGYGNGYGVGYGDGCGSGRGADSSDGDIKSINRQTVYMIDGIPTIIKKIVYGVAVGAILQGDLTLDRCFVVKSGNTFAHGETIKKAQAALMEKLFDDMSEEDRIAEFWKCHNRTDKYNGRDLWEWHHRLTGSCEMGRNQFCADRGIDIDGSEWTAAEFVELCKDSYGGSTIRRLINK